jgi:glycine/D-amino acid oxidase-like deaminating enzyme
MADVRRLLPAAAEAEIERTWAGYIDFTPDMLPTIDRLEQPGGLVLATGFSGHGFGVGPMAGQLTAELARGAEPSLDLTPFRFSRFHDGSRLEPFSVV